MAINTNQFGRTFQDRSHTFTVSNRPSSIDDDSDIYLFTVQGKRGNIVQVFPGLEYYFVPEPLTVNLYNNDYIHFCWTGSDSNSGSNDGIGESGTDRSNICPLTEEQYSKEHYSNIDNNTIDGAIGDLGTNYIDYLEIPLPDGIPDYIDYENIRNVTGSLMAGLSQDILNILCMPNGNSSGITLDNTNRTLCIEPVQVNQTGIWNFISTRNNQFGERSHKGTTRVVNQTTTSSPTTAPVPTLLPTIPTSTLPTIGETNGEFTTTDDSGENSDSDDGYVINVNYINLTFVLLQFVVVFCVSLIV